MSRDLIVFDPTGLDGMSGDSTQIMRSIDRYITEHEQAFDAPEPEPSGPIRSFLNDVTGRYLAAYMSGNGRYCNVNQPGMGGIWENTVIEFTEIAQQAGVILIDPQGNEPIMTTPSGDGLMDF